MTLISFDDYDDDDLSYKKENQTTFQGTFKVNRKKGETERTYYGLF